MRPDPLFVDAWREAGGLLGVLRLLAAFLFVLAGAMGLVLVASAALVP